MQVLRRALEGDWIMVVLWLRVLWVGGGCRMESTLEEQSQAKLELVAAILMEIGEWKTHL